MSLSAVRHAARQKDRRETAPAILAVPDGVARHSQLYVLDVVRKLRCRLSRETADRSIAASAMIVSS
jgi:hypothetical protein